MEALAVQFPIFSESSKDHKPMVAMVVILGMETPPTLTTTSLPERVGMDSNSVS